jgi:hypothetical protein
MAPRKPYTKATNILTGFAYGMQGARHIYTYVMYAYRQVYGIQIIKKDERISYIYMLG